MATAGAVPVAGTLSATEGAADTLAAEGAVVSGTGGYMSASETQQDSAAATGDIEVAGTLSANEGGADILIANASILVTLASIKTKGISVTDISTGAIAAGLDVTISANLITRIHTEAYCVGT